MSQGKTFVKLLGMESLFMILVTLIACITSFVQNLFKEYIGEYSSFIFSGSNYQYNYFMYIIGLVLYFTVAFILYKKFEKSLVIFSELHIALKIIAFIVLIFWGFVMCIMEAAVLFVTVLGLTCNLKPEAFLWITVTGWPIITVIFLGVEYIKNSQKRVK